MVYENDNNPMDSYNTSLMGLIKCALMEMPWCDIRCIDFSSSDGDDIIADVLFSEVLRGGSNGNSVVIRNNIRYQAHLNEILPSIAYQDIKLKTH